MTRRAPAVLLVAVLGGSGALVGCGAGGPLGDECLPEPLVLRPVEVRAGNTVTLSSPPFRCDGSYDDGHRYELTLALLGRQEPVDLGEAPVARDGSFSTELEIPADVSPGPAAISVLGSPLDECDDTGGGTSCAGYSVELTVLARD